MDTLAVFRSRSEALKIFSLVKKNGIACATVSTPSSLRLGCGIAIVFPHAYRDGVLSFVKTAKTSSFVGFYRR